MAPNRRLKQARELRGWSQAKVAELIGTDATTVSRWERGLFLPTPYFREKLCGIFSKNAEELGLLEATQSLHQQDIAGPPKDLGSPYMHTENGLSGTTGTTGTAGRSEMLALKPRSLPEGVDTFTYILQRSSQEQQAYMLWEHAYVQALQDQRSEAQRLGQASVNVFEQVRHPNAAVVRAWLNQQGLQSGSSHSSIADTPLPSPIHQKRSSRPWLRVGGAGVFVVLILVGGLLFANFSANHANTRVASNTNYAPQNLETNNTPTTAHHVSPTTPQSDHNTVTTNQTIPTLTPTSNSILSSPTPIPIVTPASTPTSSVDSSIMPTISPSQINPTICKPDGTAYRCTIMLAIYANTEENFSWHASSTGIPVKFNSFQGTLATGKTAQEIVYVYATCSQTGKVSFQFNPPSGTQSNTVSVSWSC
jgi:DNA-binding XRE family transcriptional regulator